MFKITYGTGLLTCNLFSLRYGFCSSSTWGFCHAIKWRTIITSARHLKWMLQTESLQEQLLPFTATCKSCSCCLQLQMWLWVSLRREGMTSNLRQHLAYWNAGQHPQQAAAGSHGLGAASWIGRRVALVQAEEGWSLLPPSPSTVF